MQILLFDQLERRIHEESFPIMESFMKAPDAESGINE